MANLRPIDRLKQGYEAWNAWREIYPNVRIDFGSANLINANLESANLSNADLSNANLSNANLSNANLSQANLSAAYLIETNLESADLSNANLESADLSYANLSNADLINVNLRAAYLIGANLRFANLRFANLEFANLRSANLSRADLSNAHLSSAYLIEVNFIDANLDGSQVLRANFSQAILTGACIADWQIGSSTILEEVECDYIFRTFDDGVYKFSSRLPVDPESKFAPGEFTQRFQIIASALETIDITFTEGIDWQAFFQAFQDLRASRPDEDISIQGMERKGDAFIVRLEVEAEADKAAIETEVKQRYAHQLAALEAQYEERLRLQGAHLEDARRTIELERQRNTEILGVIGIVAQNQGSKYDMRGAQFAGGFAETVQGNQVGGIINNYGQNADDVVRLLTSLRQLSQAFPEDQKADILMELDDLEGDLSKPEKQEPKRIGKRLQRLLAAGAAAATLAGGAATFTGSVNDFTANVLELGEKIGLTRDAIQP